MSVFSVASLLSTVGGKIFIIVPVIMAIYAGGSYLDSRGYNRAMVEVEEKYAEIERIAIKEVLERAESNYNEAYEKQERIYESALRQLTVENVVEDKTEDIIKYVDKIEINDVCSTSGIAVLLNESIDNSNRASKGNTENSN